MILYVALQRFYVQGLAVGAVKGWVLRGGAGPAGE